MFAFFFLVEIPAIPDLEETNEIEDMAFQVADAPEVQVHQLSTYKELDKEFFKEKAFQFLVSLQNTLPELNN